MDPRTLARIQAAGRLAIGTTLMVAPGLVARSWIGGDGERASVRPLAVGLGARDAAIGAGVLASVSGDPRPWLAAGAIGDLADLVATVRAADHIPRLAVAGVAVIAAGSTALGAWLVAQDAW